MAPTRPPLKSRVLGALYGSLLGDSLALPAEGCVNLLDCRGYADAIRRGLVERRFHEFPRQISDDSQLLLAVTESVSAKERVDFSDIGHRWVSLFGSNRVVREGSTCRAAITRLAGGDHWSSSGDPTGRNRGNGTLLRSAALALYLRNQPQRLTKEVMTLARMTHTHPESVACAIVFAFLLRHLLRGDGTLDWSYLAEDLAQKVADIHPATSEVISNIPHLLKKPRDVVVEEVRWFIDDAGRRVSFGGVQGTALATLASGVVGFGLYPDDPVKAICFCIEAGLDTDSTAAIAGCLVGCHCGIESLPRPIIQRIHDRQYADYKYFDELFTRFAALVIEKEEQ